MKMKCPKTRDNRMLPTTQHHGPQTTSQTTQQQQRQSEQDGAPQADLANGSNL